MVYADESRYDGTWKDNKMHGQGIYTWADGRYYKGFWKRNEMHGEGVFSWNDGRVYEGAFMRDKKHGKGELKWPDGSQYEGNFTENKLDGKGKFKTNKDREWRYGIWKNGVHQEWIEDPHKHRDIIGGSPLSRHSSQLSMTDHYPKDNPEISDNQANKERVNSQMLKKKSIQFSGDFGSISDFGSLHQIDEEDPLDDDSSEAKKEEPHDHHHHHDEKPTKSVNFRSEDPFDDENYASPLN